MTPLPSLPDLSPFHSSRERTWSLGGDLWLSTKDKTKETCDCEASRSAGLWAGAQG